MNIGHAPVFQLCPEGSWRVLRLGRAWSVFYLWNVTLVAIRNMPLNEIRPVLNPGRGSHSN